MTRASGATSMKPEYLTRADAIAFGRSRYFTGKPCWRGHVAERYTSGSCVECARVSQRKGHLFEVTVKRSELRARSMT